MSYRTGNELGTEVCEALGIDPHTVYAVTLEMDVNEVAHITTKGYVELRAPLREVMRHYTVVKRAGWAPPWPPPKLGDVYYKGGQ